MAIIYKVCTASGSANATITMTNGTCPSSWTTYTQGGCDIYEKRKTLTFHSSIPSTVDYAIYYTYSITFYENYQFIDTQLNHGSVIMRAGATTASASVFCDYYAWCTSDDAPYDRLDGGYVQYSV
jgi:hypothetical protein